MKAVLFPFTRVAVLAATVFALPLLASAHDTASADRAAELLATRGAIEFAAAGPYVETGTFRVQVRVKLGEPSQVLADGTWLYTGQAIENSRAAGTLVVRFDARGRVTRLSLVTPAVARAMARPQHAREVPRVASRE